MRTDNFFGHVYSYIVAITRRSQSLFAIPFLYLTPHPGSLTPFVRFISLTTIYFSLFHESYTFIRSSSLLPFIRP